MSWLYIFHNNNNIVIIIPIVYFWSLVGICIYLHAIHTFNEIKIHVLSYLYAHTMKTLQVQCIAEGGVSGNMDFPRVSGGMLPKSWNFFQIIILLSGDI